MKLSQKELKKLANNERLLRDVFGDALFTKLMRKEKIEMAMDTFDKAMDLAA